MRFFPIVPRNVPEDDLASYLRPFNEERAALVSVMDASAAGKLHSEWDINPPPPVMRAGLSGLSTLSGYGLDRAFGGAQCGDMPDLGQPMGRDPRAVDDAARGITVVPTVWAQRAANSAVNFGAVIGARLLVDGRAGGRTQALLASIRLQLLAALPTPIPADPSFTAPITIIDSGHIAMPRRMAFELSQGRRVADPAGSTCGMCQWGDCPATPPASPPGPALPAGPVDPGTDLSPPGAAGGGLLLVLGAAALGAWYIYKQRR
jgi:hypothetical protein